MVKIRAHHPNRHELPLLEQYWTLGNESADQAAHTACQHAMPDLVQELKQHHACAAHHQHQLENLYKLHLQLYADRKLSEQTTQPTAPQAQPDICEAFASWSIPHPQDFNLVVNEDWIQHCQWGASCASHMLAWATQLLWPVDMGAVGPHGAEGVSWTELACSFMYATQQYLPIVRVDSDQQSRIIQPGSHKSVKEYNVSLAEFTSAMVTLFDHTQSLHVAPLTPKVFRKKNNSLYIQGHRRWANGWSARPSFPHQREVAALLCDGFKRRRQHFLTSVPDIHLTERADVVLHDSLQTRQLAARDAQRRVRQARRGST